MKKTKTGIVIAVLIATILITSVVATPVVSQDAGEVETRIFPRVRNTLANLGLILLNKLPFRGDPNTLLTDIVFIEQCWKYWENDEVREETYNSLDTIIEKIDQLPENQQIATREFLLLFETFSFNEIAERISTIDPPNLLDGVKDLLDIPDTFNDFKISREEAFLQVINMFGENDFESLSMWYPLMFSICGLLRAISTLWVVPLALLGGVAGIRLANLLTMVFFSPILLPMTLYCAISECLDTDVELCEQIRQIFLEEGALGVFFKFGTILFKKIFINPCYYREAHRILMLYLLWNDLEGGGNTGQSNPEHAGWFRDPITAKTNQDIEFTICNVRDDDMLYFCDLLGNEYWEKRDYVRVGWDWDNDFSVDDWSDWTKQNNGLSISYYRSWSNVGTYTVRCILMDNFGQLGHWSDDKYVTIVKGTSNQNLEQQTTEQSNI